jgi:hypothetical protein
MSIWLRLVMLLNRKNLVQVMRPTACCAETAGPLRLLSTLFVARYVDLSKTVDSNEYADVITISQHTHIRGYLQRLLRVD